MGEKLSLWAFLVIAAAVALGLCLAGSPAVAFADHYTAGNPPVTIEPETIPLWGPSWNHSPITYSIQWAKGVSAAAIARMEQAIKDWNHAIEFHTGVANFLVPAAEGTTPDLIIRPKLGGGMVQGQVLCSSDANGFFTQCKINVSGKAFGSTNSDDTVRSIALQEIGHGLGLLHAEAPAEAPDNLEHKKDVMYGTLQDPPNIRISECDLNAWAAVMDWLLAGTLPAPPSVDSVSCGTAGGGGGAAGLPSSVTVAVDRDPPDYVHGETVKITVTVTDGPEGSGDGVPGAAVTVILTSANGKKLSGSGTTDSNGVAKFTYKVNSKRDGVSPPPYTLDATACKSGDCASGSTTFNVTS